MMAEALQQVTFDYALGGIQTEQSRRYFTRSGQGLDHRACQAKVILPPLHAWIEQSNHRAR
jgi:hypothetical protein